MDCVFCKIIAGQIPCDKVYENGAVLAFLDIAPISRGHVLVVPKLHFQDLAATPAETVSAMMDALQVIAPAVLRVTHAPAFNVGINNGAAAGQIVMHTHFHLIPRIDGDGLQSWPHQRYGPEESAGLAKDIAAALR
ncbi:MAG: Hit-like protein involved in cell-cycle regulation [Parcubacteria group bacterium Gr01-1014_31]|nr:MAG: Hit-like protein involved in cell-cycle regulation [Parcubacteria group bacterium Gr01-1014_31]